MLTRATIDRAVAAALEEDAPWGDITSEMLIPPSAVARADLIAREPGIFSGGEVFTAAFRLTDPAIDVDLLVSDGESFEKGTVLAEHGKYVFEVHPDANKMQIKAAVAPAFPDGRRHVRRG